MDWTLILTGIGTVATIISTIVTVKAKHEAKRILQEIRKETNSRNIANKEPLQVVNSGNNSGVISGINSGEIHS